MTARDAAKDLIKRYVLRGETVQQIADGYMGYYGDNYKAQIGGYMWRDADLKSPHGKPYKHISKYQIGVEKVGDREVMEVFSLHEIYSEILHERDYGKQVSLDL